MLVSSLSGNFSIQRKEYGFKKLVKSQISWSQLPIFYHAVVDCTCIVNEIILTLFIIWFRCWWNTWLKINESTKVTTKLNCLARTSKYIAKHNEVWFCLFCRKIVKYPPYLLVLLWKLTKPRDVRWASFGGIIFIWEIVMALLIFQFR